MTAFQVKEPRLGRPGILADLAVPRILSVAALVVLALAVQSALLVHATVLGVIPQLVLVVVVSLAYADGPRVGVVAGFFGGLLVDSLLPPGAIEGLTAFIYTLVGYGVAYLRQFYVAYDSVWLPVIAVAVATTVAEAGYAILAIILGQPWISLGLTAKRASLVVLYNTLLTPFVFPFVNRISERFRPERVVRW